MSDQEHLATALQASRDARRDNVAELAKLASLTATRPSHDASSSDKDAYTENVKQLKLINDEIQRLDKVIAMLRAASASDHVETYASAAASDKFSGAAAVLAAAAVCVVGSQNDPQ